MGILAASGLLIGSLVVFLLRLYDNSPGASSSMHVPSSAVITGACIAAVFIAAFALAITTNRSHRNAVSQFAASQGWSLSDADTLGLDAIIEGLFQDRDFKCCQTMTVESGPRRIYLVDGTYSEDGPKADMHLASACLVESERLQSVPCRVEILTRRWVDKVLLSGQVQLDDSEFARQFIVISDAPSAARLLLDSSLQQVLLAYAAQPLYARAEIVIGQGRIALITPCITENESWHILLDVARKVESIISAR